MYAHKGLEEFLPRHILINTQAAMRQLLELQGAAKLPEDMQWAIRMLLPRPAGSPAPVAPAAAAAAVAMASSAGAGGAEGAGHAAALALLAEHAQQAQAHVSSKLHFS